MKFRHPDSFEAALVTIAHAIGWARVAEIANRTDRTVRDWSDPDTPRTPPIGTALALDRAWSNTGRPGAPLTDALNRQRGRPAIAVTFNPTCLGEATRICIVEGGQAKQALVHAIMPGATPEIRREAAREVAESIAAYEATLPLLAIPLPCPP